MMMWWYIDRHMIADLGGGKIKVSSGEEEGGARSSKIKEGMMRSRG